MKQPTMVYRYPGSAALGFKHGKDIFDHKVVDSHAEEGEESQLDAALADGWFPSPAEAKAGAIDDTGDDTGDDTTPPTREELEAKAIELGIEFTKRTKDETLLEKIETALAEQEG